MAYGIVNLLLLLTGFVLIALDVSVWLVLPATLVALFAVHTFHLVIRQRRAK